MQHVLIKETEGINIPARNGRSRLECGGIGLNIGQFLRETGLVGQWSGSLIRDGELNCRFLRTQVDL